MATISHESPSARGERRWTWMPALASEVGASIAISVIWLAVLFDAVFGPNIVTSTAGGDHSSVPSAVVVSFFAVFATWIVARYGFRASRKD
jgi:hypothetical protein